MFYTHSQQIQSSTNSKIKMTSKDLQRLTIVVRRGDKQQKLQVEKLTNDFKMIFEMFIQSQQVIKNEFFHIFHPCKLKNVSNISSLHSN